MWFSFLKDFPYDTNGTSTFRLIKVRLSGDVEENPGRAITGVRGVSGPSHVANSGQRGASLPSPDRTNTNSLSVFMLIREILSTRGVYETWN